MNVFNPFIVVLCKKVITEVYQFCNLLRQAFLLAVSNYSAPQLFLLTNIFVLINGYIISPCVSHFCYISSTLWCVSVFLSGILYICQKYLYLAMSLIFSVRCLKKALFCYLGAVDVIREEGKDPEIIQSSTTSDPEHHMGFVTTNPVLGVWDNVRLKPVPSAAETS